ncbi:MAG: recombinase family protein [Clostridium sp.]|nr:recombinase family protein [Clostridium sp.]
MARKSRVITETQKQESVKSFEWKIGIYIRLSKEDLRNNDESESVTNQRKINLEFVEEKFCNETYIIYDIYVDDGRSGTTEDTRPDFQRLSKDIREGNVNCVVCKTLARAFRNYADQGKFLEQYLPTYGCRFIAFGNPYVDTFANPDCTQNMEIPINGLMNDRYAARTSEDVRKTFRTKRNNGEFIGAFAPFGYLKNPENKNAFIIDEDTAEIVREIFEKYLAGMSKLSIVRYLNDHGILCPTVYKQKRLELKYQNPHSDPTKTPLWSEKTVGEILRNQMYCGDMVQGRYRIKSYKVHIQEKVPEEEWFIKENTHEPIIDREIFDKVQRLLQKDTRTSPKNDTLYLFSGFLRCADCEKAMVRSEVKKHVYYYCSTYKRRSKKACTKHSIQHNRLEAAVLFAIQQYVYLAIDYTKIIEQINRAPIIKSQDKKLLEAISKKERELTKVIRYKQAVYQDWKDNEISQTDYRRMREDYEIQEKEITTTIKKLQNERAEQENGVDTENPFLAAFRKYENVTTLSRDILIDLVDSITVYEGGNISIVLRFADELRRVQDFIEINTQSEAV